jgi:thiol:disulfide interchange protein DsbD
MTALKSLFVLLLISSSSLAQMAKPLHWTWKAEKIKNDEYKLVFTALIDKPWHTYGMYIQDGGPVKTSFNYDKNANVQLVGKMTESGPKSKEMVDDVFQVKVKLFEEKAIFEQMIKAKPGTKVTGSVEFMACDDKSCLAPETKKFEIAIP